MTNDPTKDKMMRNVAMKLKFARNIKGITQEELAFRVGMHSKYLSQIECGRNPNMSFWMVIRLCHELGLAPNDLLQPVDLS